MRTIIAVINKRGETATRTAIAMLKILEHRNVEAIGISSPFSVKIEKSSEALQNQNVNSPVVIGHALSRTFASDRSQPIKLKNATLVFDGRIYSARAKTSDIEFVVKRLQNSGQNVETLVKEADGDFAFALARPKGIIAGRDALGIRPLYYGENAELAALASQRKALWKIGIGTVYSFPPGHISIVDKRGFKFKAIKTLAYLKAKQINMHAAAKKLQKLLQRSFNERVFGLKEVAVAFSGGLDSSVIAFLAKNSGLDVHLIHVSLQDQPETEYAKKVAEELELPFHVYLYSGKHVKEIIPEILWLIEEPNPVKMSIAIPFYWTAEKTAEMKIKVLLAGQGADELFGGYKRYANDYLQYGGEEVQRTIFNDVVKMHEANFERDSKICNFHNIELRLPFVTYPIAKFAIELPVDLKLRLPDDGLRKLVLRQVAKNLGIPEFIVRRSKRAMQYTTGTSNILKKLAKMEGLLLKEYLQKKFRTVLEKMMEYE